MSLWPEKQAVPFLEDFLTFECVHHLYTLHVAKSGEVYVLFVRYFRKYELSSFSWKCKLDQTLLPHSTHPVLSLLHQTLS